MVTSSSKLHQVIEMSLVQREIPGTNALESYRDAGLGVLDEFQRPNERHPEVVKEQYRVEAQVGEFCRGSPDELSYALTGVVVCVPVLLEP